MDSTKYRKRALRHGNNSGARAVQPNRVPGAHRRGNKNFLLLAALLLGCAVLFQDRPAVAQGNQLGMDFGYSYLAAPSWPDPFPYGFLLGFKYGDRLKLGGSITVYLSHEYTLTSTIPLETLSAGRHVSEHAILLLVTADYDLLPRDEYRFVPFVSLGAGYFYGDVIFAEAVDPQPGIENATVLGDDMVDAPALRAGIGLRRCFAVGRSSMWGTTEPCLSARVEYLWAPGKLLKDTPYEIHGNLGGLALGLVFGF